MTVPHETTPPHVVPTPLMVLHESSPSQSVPGDFKAFMLSMPPRSQLHPHAHYMSALTINHSTLHVHT
ncbi:hypothetical protein F2Q69_00029526 [Brassica cretica]|uniref:Uncharacterized protein n=1 Tax=Brassica cretica TaxID=69181 RepID=A0A8S9S0R5_BRACR|nr:hypothetical protein F2Q69_00029526 [Brassica cretica]